MAYPLMVTHILPRPRYPNGLTVAGKRLDDTAVGVQDVWPGAALEMPLLDTAESLDVIADDAANTLLGTGAQKVQVILLDSTWNVVRHEIELNGTTAVAIPGGPYMRVLRAVANFTGSFGTVENDIVRVRTSTGPGNPIDLAVIPVGGVSSIASAWTFTESRYPWGVIHWSAAISDVQQQADLTFSLQLRNFTLGGAWIPIGESPTLNDDNRFFEEEIAPVTVNDKTDVHDLRIRFASDKPNIHTRCAFTIIQNERALATLDEVL